MSVAILTQVHLDNCVYLLDPSRFLLMSSSPDAYATKADLHIWWVKLPAMMTRHPYQMMDADTMTINRIVQVSYKTGTEWTYAVHACFGAAPDDCIFSWLAIAPERRRTVYVHGQL